MPVSALTHFFRATMDRSASYLADLRDPVLIAARSGTLGRLGAEHGERLDDGDGSLLRALSADGLKDSCAFLLARNDYKPSQLGEALCDALGNGWPYVAYDLVRAGADIHYRDERPLISAIRSDNADAVRFALYKKADAGARGVFALITAVGEHKNNALGALIAERPELLKGKPADWNNGEQAFLHAVQKCNYVGMAMLANHIDVTDELLGRAQRHIDVHALPKSWHLNVVIDDIRRLRDIARMNDAGIHMNPGFPQMRLPDAMIR